MKKIMASGIQPTGSLHLGNYLGAMKNWVALQDEYNAYFFIVDYHAITINYDITLMQKRIIEAATEYIACGIDPKRSNVFVQSHVPAHTELAWILNSIIPVGELERMTQYKDKSKKNEENINAALLTYPVLMAADIILYKPDIVPVGEDQDQHVELTRAIVRKFNNKFGEYFKEPATYHSKSVRLLGLDGESKMSKSLNNYIALRHTDEETEKLILSQAITDKNRLRKTDKGNPEVCNVFSYHKIFSPKEEQAECYTGCTTASIGCVDCKKKLIKNINKDLAPIREKIRELDNNKKLIEDILDNGAIEANKKANDTLYNVRSLMGLNKSW